MNAQRYSLAGVLAPTGDLFGEAGPVNWASPQDHSQHFLGYTIEHKNLPEKRRFFWSPEPARFGGRRSSAGPELQVPG